MRKIPVLVLLDLIIILLWLVGLICANWIQRLPPRQDRPAGYYDQMRGEDS